MCLPSFFRRLQIPAAPLQRKQAPHARFLHPPCPLVADAALCRRSSTNCCLRFLPASCSRASSSSRWRSRVGPPASSRLQGCNCKCTCRSDMKADSSNAQFLCPVCLSRCTWAPPCDKLRFSNLISCVCTPLSALPSAEAYLGFMVCSLGPSRGAPGSWSVGSSAA